MLAKCRLTESLLPFKRALGARAETEGSTASSEVDRAAPAGSKHTDVCERHPQRPARTPPAARSLSHLCHRASHGRCPRHAHARTPAHAQLAGTWLNSHRSSGRRARPAAGSAYLERKDSRNPRRESSTGASFCLPFTRSKKRCFLCQQAKLPPQPCLFPCAFAACSLCIVSPGPGGKE